MILPAFLELDAVAQIITRRQFLTTVAGLAATGAMLGGYAFAIEPYRLYFPRYRLTPANWPAGLKLKIAAIADLHTCHPWMTAQRVRSIVHSVNAQKPDIVVLLGDFIATHRFVSEAEDKAAWTAALAELEAPLGVHAVQGNHDWWESKEVQRKLAGPTPVARALEAVGIPVYENKAVRIEKDGKAFWLAGLGDQWAFYRSRDLEKRWRSFGYEGVDDLEGTLAQVTDDAPVIMMAHEPDVFDRMPRRVSLTMSGYTHGGQVQFMGIAPVVPSRFGRRYVYGHVQEAERDLIVSGGLGCSGLPIRFGRPPEVPIIELG
ncbi:MAG: putative MPP superfamily phosphohydrolase [Hyphomicrobiaceae bacterium]|jgi:predicted MPP superfamily phosphohydrolase